MLYEYLELCQLKNVEKCVKIFDNFLALKMIIQTDVSARVPWPSSG